MPRINRRQLPAGNHPVEQLPQRRILDSSFSHAQISVHTSRFTLQRFTFYRSTFHNNPLDVAIASWRTDNTLRNSACAFSNSACFALRDPTNLASAAFSSE